MMDLVFGFLAFIILLYALMGVAWVIVQTGGFIARLFLTKEEIDNEKF